MIHCHVRGAFSGNGTLFIVTILLAGVLFLFNIQGDLKSVKRHWNTTDNLEVFLYSFLLFQTYEAHIGGYPVGIIATCTDKEAKVSIHGSPWNVSDGSCLLTKASLQLLCRTHGKVNSPSSCHIGHFSVFKLKYK